MATRSAPDGAVERLCPRCGRWLSLEANFGRRTLGRAGQWQSWCKPCHREYALKAPKEPRLPVYRAPSSYPPTSRQIDLLRARVRHGGMKAAAYHEGIRIATLKRQLTVLYIRLGVSGPFEAIYALWLKDLWGD